MVVAQTDDGQRLLALNEVYVGHRSHQSARYRLITPDGFEERQSSSGILTGTGSGSTGWCRSVWQSPATGTTCTQGLLKASQQLTIVAESDLVVFGDGIESDTLTLSWGQHLELRTADTLLNLVR
jgi:hypothetical protein